MILPVTLTAAGAAGLINLWLAMRIGRIRTSQKIMMGDGGNPVLIGAMRAHSNFIEYTPLVVILIALIEFASGTSIWLWVVSAVFLLGRVAHALGMTGAPSKLRMIGTITTMLIMTGLAIYALVIPYMAPSHPIMTEVIRQG